MVASVVAHRVGAYVVGGMRNVSLPLRGGVVDACAVRRGAGVRSLRGPGGAGAAALRSPFPKGLAGGDRMGEGARAPGSSGRCVATKAFEVPAAIVEQWNRDPIEFVAGQLFAFSLFPYLGFLYHLTKAKKVPGMALFGFYFLLFFVFATIPAAIYAKTEYGESLANVDWLHGTAESMLTLTNLFIVLGFRAGMKAAGLGAGEGGEGGARGEGAEQREVVGKP